jgi:hypothetical protein
MMNTPREVTLKGQGEKGRLHKVADCRQDRINTRTQSQKDNKKHIYNHSFSCLALVLSSLQPPIRSSPLLALMFTGCMCLKTMKECGLQHFFNTCMHRREVSMP